MISDTQKTAQSFEVMMVGFENSPVNRVFSSLCGLKQYTDYSIYAEKGIESDIYFHLTPNIRDINHLKSIIESCIYGSFQQINKIVFVLQIYLEYNHKPKIHNIQILKSFLDENQYYCQYITFMLACSSEIEKKLKTNDVVVYQSNGVNIPLIYLNLGQLEQQQYIRDINAQIITFPQLFLPITKQIEVQRFQINLKQIKYQINEINKCIIESKNNRSTINKFVQILIFLTKNMLKNIANEIQKLQYYERYELLQLLKIKFHQNLKNMIHEVIEIIKQRIQQINNNFIKKCQKCQELVLLDQQYKYECYKIRIFDANFTQRIDYQQLTKSFLYQSDCFCKDYIFVDDDEIEQKKQQYIQNIQSYYEYFIKLDNVNMEQYKEQQDRDNQLERENERINEEINKIIEQQNEIKNKKQEYQDIIRELQSQIYKYEALMKDEQRSIQNSQFNLKQLENRLRQLQHQQ